MKKPDLNIGDKYGNFTILEKVGVGYKCQCDCGEILIRRRARITNSNISHSDCSLNNDKKHFNLKLDPQTASYRAKFSNYKGVAKYRGHIFEISYDIFIKLVTDSCYYCGNKPNNSYNSISRNRKYKKSYNYYDKKEYDILYNGIDRIDSSKGYIEGNVVSCCKHCNTAKLDRTFEEFKNWISQVYKKLNDEK